MAWTAEANVNAVSITSCWDGASAYNGPLAVLCKLPAMVLIINSTLKHSGPLPTLPVLPLCVEQQHHGTGFVYKEGLYKGAAFLKNAGSLC